MMKEMMIRLIKNDKIVGYEWKLPYDDAIKLCTGYDEYCFPKEKWSGKIVSVDSVDMGHWVMVEDFTYDSFELGIKVGDEWWFINDRVQAEFNTWLIGDIGKEECIKWQKMSGTIDQKDDGRIVVVWDNGDKSEPLIRAINMSDFKRIGTIHDGEKA